MRVQLRGLRLFGLALAFLGMAASSARADVAPKWSDAELTRFSQVILTGRVVDVAAGWDDGAAYTYVTLDISDVLKGWLPERQVVVKQLGGRVDDLALVVGGQATFVRGEQVLLFLEARPRDRTLSTTALWQGKWNVRADPVSGSPIAVRSIPGSGGRQALGQAADARELAAFTADIRRLAGDASSQRSTTELSVRPRDANAAVPVRDVDATAIFTPIPLERNEPAFDNRCVTTFRGDGRLSIAMNDPCGEMSPDGGTLAISATWVNAATRRGRRGDEAFMQILQAGIMMNGGSTAREFLSSASCLASIESHELGHASGRRDESAAGTMQPFLDRACREGQHPNTAGIGGSLRVGGASVGAISLPAAVNVQTTRVSVASDGSQANGPSSGGSISRDGRYVVFLSQAPNLTGQSASTFGVILHDNQTGQTTNVGIGKDQFSQVRITADGRYIVFQQAGTPFGSLSWFDRTTGITTTFTPPPPPSPNGNPPEVKSVSDDVRFVLVTTLGQSGFVADRQTGTTTLLPQSLSINTALLSPDGRYVAIMTTFVHTPLIYDRQTGQTIAVGGTSGYLPDPVPRGFSTDNHFALFGNGLYDLSAGRVVVSFSQSQFGVSISASGRYVSYNSGTGGVYAIDQQTGQTLRASVGPDGTSGNGPSSGGSLDDGGRVVYQSTSTNLIANDTNGVSDVFLTAGGVDAALPGNPTGLTSRVTGLGSSSIVTLNWTAPDVGGAASSYIIEAGSASGLSDVAYLPTGSMNTSFTATVGGTGTFYVRIRSSNSAGISPPSNEVIVSVGGISAPGAPTSLQVAVAGSTVTLTWRAPTSGGPVTSYIIQASSTPGGPPNLANFSTGSPATTFTATGVGAGTYFVRVLAANDVGVGTPSNEVVVILLGQNPCTSPPGAPTGLSSTVSGSIVTLQWTAGAGPTSSYVVEAGSSSGAANLANFDTGSAATSLVAVGVGSGTYFIRVKGRNACGTSGPSNEVIASVQ